MDKQPISCDIAAKRADYPVFFSSSSKRPGSDGCLRTKRDS
jgi:hypothetical protein